MYYTVYKTTNLINNKFYVGTHKTIDLNDIYLGSGNVLKRAIKKYSEENFLKTYIAVFDNAEQMFQLEKQIVNEEFILRKDTYNIRIGGQGGFEYCNTTGKRNGFERNEIGQKMGPVAYSCRYHSDPEFRAQMYQNILLASQKGSQRKAELMKDSSFRKNLSVCIKSSLTEEVRLKHKNRLKEIQHQQGHRNSQYGKCWVMHLEQKLCRFIQRKELQYYTQSGWVKGRKFFR